MNENVNHTVDRSKWPAGPWDMEPEDRVDFVHDGFACLMLRNAVGAWCGYVGVPPGHKWHGVDYEDIPVITVHGGLTYSFECSGSICHVPEPGMPDDVWWLGFDTAHSGDRTPLFSLDGIYRTKEYVENEIRHLVRQVKEN